MAATLSQVQGSFQKLNGIKERSLLPNCPTMDKFLAVLTGAVPAWSAEDQGAFKKLVEEEMPPLLFVRYKNSLRGLVGLPPLKEEPKKGASRASFEEVVKGQQKLEKELETLRKDIASLREALASKRKKKT